MTNVYLEKLAGHYQDLNHYRKNLNREAEEMYHRDWAGHVPGRITQHAMEDFRDETYMDEYGNVVTPDLNDLVRDRMKNRYINATIERDYGNDVVRKADGLAHNGASWKGAGAMVLGGVGGFAAARAITKHPLLVMGAGIAGMGLGAYSATTHALDRGEEKADEYLEGVHNQYLSKAASLTLKEKSK